MEEIDDAHLDKLVGLDEAIKNNTLISDLRKSRLLQELNCIRNCSGIAQKIGDIEVNRGTGDLDKHIMSKH